MCTSGRRYSPLAQAEESLAHDGGGDDGVDLDAGDVVAAGSQRARHVPAAAGPDDQGLGAGPEHIGQGGPLPSRSRRWRAVRWSKSKLAMPVAASASMKMESVAHGDARKAVPLDELFLRQLLALGVADVNDVVRAVVGEERHQRPAPAPRQRRAHRTRHAVPDGAGGGEQHGRQHHRAGPAEVIQQRNQQQASGGGAQQVEEVDPVDALDGFRNGQRDNRAGNEKRQRGGEIDQRQVPVAGLVLLRQHTTASASDHQQAVEHAQTAQLRNSGAFQPATTYENTPPAPRPNRAMEIARKAKW